MPKFGLDTNIVLYHLGGRLSMPLPAGTHYISFITEMELLSYPRLTQTDEQRILVFLQQVKIIPITENIKASAIALRKASRLKLPDAIIAATADDLNATLLTNDLKLTQVKNILVQNLEIT